MIFDLSIPSQLMQALTPELSLMAGAMVLMLVAAWRQDSAEHQRFVGVASMGVIVATMALVLWSAGRDLSSGPGVIAVDGFRWAADLIFLTGALATIALAIDYNAKEGILAAESHVLVLFATSGMMILAGARDLMIVFLGIEIMSIAVYVLAGLNRRSGRAAEAALKYFLLGAFSTGFLLYGIALVYGATGTTSLPTIGYRIQEYVLYRQPMLLVGVGLLLVGFAFKVAVAPFHMWAPDVYEGAPTPITAYMATAVKAAAFAGFLRVWIEAFGLLGAAWVAPIWWMAAITMVLGNVVALSQRNVKRMLAYSSVVHSGYLLVAVAAGTRLGSAAFLFYLFAYTLATFGAFAIVGALSLPGERNLEITDYDGLWNVRPGLAVAMAVYLLALLGFPVFGGVGFFAKWYLLQAALNSPNHLVSLVVLLVLTSVVSAGYYLNVVRVMFMKVRPESAIVPAPLGAFTRAVVAATVVLILALGLMPGRLAQWTMQHPPTPAKSLTAVKGQTASALR